MVKKILASCVGLVCLLGSPVRAQEAAEPAEDFGRDSLYGGLGLIYGVANFNNNKFLPGSDSSNTLGMDVRAGYRFHPNLAAEANFQWLNNFEFKKDGTKVESSPRTFTANIKGYPLTGRFQPYGVGGIGILYERTTGRDNLQEFMGRVGLGLDVFVTNNIVANIEFAYGLPIGDLDEYHYFPIVFGIQYHTD